MLRPGFTSSGRVARDGGFTLVELAVVTSIIAVLVAIAVPAFLGLQRRAQDRAAQANLRSGLGAAKTAFVDGGDYTQVDEAALEEVEPQLSYVAASTESGAAAELSVGSPDADTFTAVARSRSGTCFAIRDTASSSGGTRYASTTTGECRAGAAWALSASDRSW